MRLTKSSINSSLISMVQAHKVCLVLISTRYQEEGVRLDSTLARQQKKSRTRDFFKNTGAIATLGTGLAFSLILSTLQDPKEASRWALIDLRTVRILLAISWLLFMVTLALSFTWDGQKRTRAWRWKTLYLLDIAAVACLSVVVAAYVEVVGFVDALLAIVFGVIVLLN